MKNTVAPIMLGGEPAVSLETYPELSLNGLTRKVKDRTQAAEYSRVGTWRQEPEPQINSRVDVDRLWRALALDDDERAFLIANKLDYIPRRLIASQLGWNSAKVEAVRVRVWRKVDRVASSHFPDDFIVRGNSRQLSYREKNCWSLTPIPEHCAKIMAAEREYIKSANSPTRTAATPIQKAA